VTVDARRGRVQDLALSVLLGVVTLGPLLVRRGFALRGDMVFVPHQPWKDAWLGWDGSTSRFVPGDAVLSVLTLVVPGDLLQKALLLAIFVLAGTGAGLLVRHHGFVARAAAIVLICWNPWVAERLLIGQWGVVVGYAALCAGWGSRRCGPHRPRSPVPSPRCASSSCGRGPRPSSPCWVVRSS
jgi:hypothetical protein